MKTQFLTAVAAVSLILGGCKTVSAPPKTGFISDYSNLVAEDEGQARFISPKLADYSSFMIDPIEMRTSSDSLDAEQRAQVANYFYSKFVEELKGRDFSITQTPGTGVARVRIAITDIKASTWWKSLHPASKLTGAGTGGASMEGEIIDSVTGEQLGAVVQSGRGNQFELDAFSKLDDIEDVIDEWVSHAGDQLDSLRDGGD